VSYLGISLEQGIGCSLALTNRSSPPVQNPHCINPDINGRKIIPSSPRQRFQFPQRLIRLTQFQPIIGTRDPHGVWDRKLASAASLMVGAKIVRDGGRAIAFDWNADGLICRCPDLYVQHEWI